MGSWATWGAAETQKKHVRVCCRQRNWLILSVAILAQGRYGQPPPSPPLPPLGPPPLTREDRHGRHPYHADFTNLNKKSFHNAISYPDRREILSSNCSTTASWSTQLPRTRRSQASWSFLATPMHLVRFWEFQVHARLQRQAGYCPSRCSSRRRLHSGHEFGFAE